MAKRIEPKQKSFSEILHDIRAGYEEAAGYGAPQGQRYLEKVLASQQSLPNAAKFFAYDLLVEACHRAEDEDACLEAIGEAQRYLEVAQNEAARDFADYLPALRFCERGIGLWSDANEIEKAIALCDVAIGLGLGKVYEAKRASLERRL